MSKRSRINYQKGKPGGPGRPKGARNRVGADLAREILQAAADTGFMVRDGVRSGLKRFLSVTASRNSTSGTTDSIRYRRADNRSIARLIQRKWFLENQILFDCSIPETDAAA
jgi:hypothetical protein